MLWGYDMRLTDLTSYIDIPGVEDQTIPLDELMAIGAAASAAAAVGWIMTQKDTPILASGLDRADEMRQLATDTLRNVSENITEMSAESAQAAAEILKVLGPLGLLTG